VINEMARIRYLKPDFFTDEDLANLDPKIRLTFAGLWCHADKAGRLEDRPKYLKAMIWPYDNIDIDKHLQELCKPKNGKKKSPFIQRYESEGLELIQIISWEKHQKPHHTEKESTYPDPPPLNNPPFNIKIKGMGMGSVHDGSTELSNGEVTVIKPLMLGEFKNVKLSQDEFFKLNERLGEKTAQDLIERLSGYIASKGKKYKSHYATILQWQRKENTNGDEKNNNSGVRKFLEGYHE